MSDSPATDRLDARAVTGLIMQARRQGVPVVALTVVDGPGAGSHAVVRAGELIGTLRDTDLDSAAVQLAEHVLASGTAELQHIGDFTVFAEPVLPSSQLYIVGAGHIAVPLAELGVMLGFEVTVLDDRDDFATPERFHSAARVLRVDFREPFQNIALDPRAYVVLVTRAHKYDYDCLQQLLTLPEPPHYIGMIGSRRRVRAAFHALTEAGISAESIATVRAPIGLDIGAETPAEIAVSIAAELIRVRSGGTGTSLNEQERVLQRFFPTTTPNA